MSIRVTARLVWWGMALYIILTIPFFCVQNGRIRAKKGEIARLQGIIDKQNADLVTYEQVRVSDSARIVRAEASIVQSDRSAAEQNRRNGEIISTLEAKLRIRQIIYIHDTIYIPFATDTSDPDTPDLGIRTDSIAVPQPFYLPGEWLTIRGSVKKGGISIDSMSIPNEQVISLERRREGTFYQKERYYVTISNSNPYMTTKAVKAVRVDPKGKRIIPWVGHVALFFFGLGRLLR